MFSVSVNLPGLLVGIHRVHLLPGELKLAEDDKRNNTFPSRTARAIFEPSVGACVTRVTGGDPSLAVGDDDEESSQLDRDLERRLVYSETLVDEKGELTLSDDDIDRLKSAYNQASAAQLADMLHAVAYTVAEESAAATQLFIKLNPRFTAVEGHTPQKAIIEKANGEITIRCRYSFTFERRSREEVGVVQSEDVPVFVEEVAALKYTAEGEPYFSVTSCKISSDDQAYLHGFVAMLENPEALSPWVLGQRAGWHKQHLPENASVPHLVKTLETVSQLGVETRGKAGTAAVNPQGAYYRYYPQDHEDPDASAISKLKADLDRRGIGFSAAWNSGQGPEEATDIYKRIARAYVQYSSALLFTLLENLRTRRIIERDSKGLPVDVLLRRTFSKQEYIHPDAPGGQFTVIKQEDDNVFLESSYKLVFIAPPPEGREGNVTFDTGIVIYERSRLVVPADSGESPYFLCEHCEIGANSAERVETFIGWLQNRELPLAWLHYDLAIEEVAPVEECLQAYEACRERISELKQRLDTGSLKQGRRHLVRAELLLAALNLRFQQALEARLADPSQIVRDEEWTMLSINEELTAIEDAEQEYEPSEHVNALCGELLTPSEKLTVELTDDIPADVRTHAERLIKLVRAVHSALLSQKGLINDETQGAQEACQSIDENLTRLTSLVSEFKSKREDYLNKNYELYCQKITSCLQTTVLESFVRDPKNKGAFFSKRFGDLEAHGEKLQKKIRVAAQKSVSSTEANENKELLWGCYHYNRSLCHIRDYAEMMLGAYPGEQSAERRQAVELFDQLLKRSLPRQAVILRVRKEHSGLYECIRRMWLYVKKLLRQSVRTRESHRAQSWRAIYEMTSASDGSSKEAHGAGAAPELAVAEVEVAGGLPDESAQNAASAPASAKIQPHTIEQCLKGLGQDTKNLDVDRTLADVCALSLLAQDYKQRLASDAASGDPDVGNSGDDDEPVTFAPAAPAA